MIARCKGIGCSIRETCYRWLLDPVDDLNNYVQSMFSPMHHSCRNYWKVKNIPDNSHVERHANMLNAMIERMNRETFRN